jgi:alpha-tubulin suppressor-like RCC1 family protein
MDDGTVRSWGSNDSGRLGNGSNIDSRIPVTVSGLDQVTDLGTGTRHVCALRKGGTIHCWGDNTYGQLGNGTTTSQMTPVNVTGITQAVAIAAGVDHNCALLQNTTVQCWGSNDYGQLGDGTTISTNRPVAVIGLYSVSAIAAGRKDSCALPLSNTGAVTCWGWNSHNQLGGDFSGFYSVSPVTVLGAVSASVLIAGDQHNCVLIGGGSSSGTVQCWGWNYWGQLGIGTWVDNGPANVFGITSATAVTASSQTCALLSGGKVKCWGYNLEGELGDGTQIEKNTPADVVGLDNVNAVSAGSAHTCALLSSGQVKCWGDNALGELGDGTLTSSTVPVAVTGL